MRMHVDKQGKRCGWIWEMGAGAHLCYAHLWCTFLSSPGTAKTVSLPERGEIRWRWWSEDASMANGGKVRDGGGFCASALSLSAHERMCAYSPQMVTEVATVAKSGFAVVLRDTSAPSRAHPAMRVAASDLGRWAAPHTWSTPNPN